MRQLIKYFLWIGSLAWGLQSAWAFSLLGPVANGTAGNGSLADTWQQPPIGYNPLPPSDVAYNGFYDLLPIGPKNLGEGYRRNTPVMYYTFDPSFGDFFGSNGEFAVQQAFDLLNGVMNGYGNTPLFLYAPDQGFLGDTNGGPPVVLYPTNGIDSYNLNLSEFPLNTEVQAYTVSGLGTLYDLKSTTLSLLLEQLGLADAVRYTWCLHDVYHSGSAPCPAGQSYLVIQRNYDYVPTPLDQVQYSAYVNDELYYYQIIELCSAPAPITPPNEAARPYPFDNKVNNPPVASGNGLDPLLPGYFYTGLTRDDVAGLRWLYSTNNYDTPSLGYRESPAAGSALMSYSSTQQLLSTSNYNALVATSLTNDPTTIQALYPAINFTKLTDYYSNVVSETLTYVTNFPVGGVSGQPYIGLQKTYTTNLVHFFRYTFDNVVVNSNYPTTTYRYQTITIGPPIGSPVGSPFVTNVSLSQPFQSNVVSGDYFVITNGTCPPAFLETLRTNVNLVTNTLSGITNTDGSSIVQNLVYYYTNYTYAVRFCTLGTGVPSDYQGIGRMQFIRVQDGNYDYLNQQFIVPITNQYTMVMMTNNQYVTQTFQRVLITPDFLFGASDQASGPAGVPAEGGFVRTVNFNQANIQQNLAGPGTIDPGIVNAITFDKVGTLFENTTSLLRGPPSSSGTNSAIGFLWGSFDDTTNLPVIYPNGTSLVSLANEAVEGIHISPPILPDGTNGAAYAVTLTATGNHPPYTLTPAPLTGGLPPGLTLTSTNSGLIISGTPTQSGTFINIEIQAADSETPPRSVEATYSLTIHNPVP